MKLRADVNLDSNILVAAVGGYPLGMWPGGFAFDMTGSYRLSVIYLA